MRKSVLLFTFDQRDVARLDKSAAQLLNCSSMPSLLLNVGRVVGAQQEC